MSYDISQPIPQGSDGAQDAENSRISAITDELKRLCAVYEAQRGDCVEDVNRFEYGTLFPRNVLVDEEGDIFVVDAEIKQL
jgi:hypothetical protein